MNGLIEFFIRRSLFGNIITFAVVLAGGYSMTQIRRETFPNVKFDVVNISTAFPGASPDEVERLITNVIEQEIREIDGIKTVNSNSYEGLSSIGVQLDPDQTTDAKAKSDIQDIIDRLTSLPEAAKKPVVTTLETKQQPVIEVVIGGLQGPEGELQLRKAARFLEKEIETLRDVARVAFRGLRKQEYRVEADLTKLSRNRVSLEELSDALRRQNVSVPGGTLEPVDPTRGEQRILRAIGDFRDASDIENTVIRGNDLGRTLRVKDVATVKFGLEKRSELNAVDGKEAIRLTVIQKEKADTIRLVETLKAKVESVRPQLPAELQITYLNDVSEFITRRLEVLNGNLALGLLLVLVLLSAILPVRVALMVSLGIPFAFLGTMIVFFSYDITLNLISLIGLIIVSGMLVDDAIVVTDNAVRYMEEGLSPTEAALRGTQEIWPSVIASVLTTIVAFLPLMFMSGIFGKFVKPISFGVIIALTISLLEAFFVLPAHIADYIRVQPKGSAPPKARGIFGRLGQAFDRFWDQRVILGYGRMLRRLIARRYQVAIASVLGFVAVLVLASTTMRVILFPPQGIEIFTITTNVPTGTPLEKHWAQLKPIQAQIEKLPPEELDHYATLIGENRLDPLEPGFRKGSEFAVVTVYLTPEKKRSRSADDIIEALRKDVGKPASFTEVTFGRVSGGPPVGAPVSLAVSGSTYQELLPAIAKLKADLGAIPGVRDIKDTYTLGKKEIRIRLKSDEAAAAGLNVLAVGNSLRSSYEGSIATSIRTLDEEIDVRVQLNKQHRENQTEIANVLVPNAQGSLVRLGAVSSLESSQGISVYDHKNYSRVILVTADVNTDVTSSLQVNQKIKDGFAEFQKKFPGVKIAFGGEDEDTQEALKSLVTAFGFAFLAIFLILVMTFKSLSQPILVILTIPMGVAAVLLAFFTHGWPITFLGMMGIIALAGVIVNNAIVIVDFVNNLRAQGVDRFESIYRAGAMRVRPVFLTTVTTVVGVMPTAYGIGGEDKFVVPIALALGWGLLFGSVLTVFLFPTAIAILDDVQAWIAKWRPGSRPGVADDPVRQGA